MAYLAATDINVALNPEDIDRSPDGRIGIRTFPVVSWTDASKYYTALGIPMPAIAKFGFNFAIKRAYIEQPANGFIYHFDRANQKLRIFLGAARAALTAANITPTGNIAVANTTGVSAGTPAGNIANAAFVGDLIADAGANYTPTGNLANSTFVGAALATHTHGAQSATFTGDALVLSLTGGGAVAEAALAEMDNGVAPGATTLNMEMVGR